MTTDSVVDTGPLDWRIAITDKAGRPTPEFQRRWQTQRANNDLIGGITVGSGVPTGTPKDGAGYVDISTTPYTLYVGSGGTWHIVGVVDFTDLADVPHNYTSAGNKLVKVNSGATALEFASESAILDLISNVQGSILYRGNTTWDALAPSTAGFVLTTEGSAANPQWLASSGETGFGFSIGGRPSAGQLVGIGVWSVPITFISAGPKDEKLCPQSKPTPPPLSQSRRP